MYRDTGKRRLGAGERRRGGRKKREGRKVKRGGRNEKRGGRKEKRGRRKEKRAREGRSIPLPVHPTFTVHKRYARFGRSVLKTDRTKRKYTSTFRNFVANLPVSAILV